MKKIYSSMDCGCYRYEGSSKWIICGYHSPNNRLKSKFLNIISGTSSSYRHFKLYVLKLKDDKYYVGITAKNNPYTRISEHINGCGARWTLIHSPIKVVSIKDLGFVSKNQAEHEENNLTLEYMKKHGTQNVRGGKNTTTGLVLLKNYNTFTAKWFIVNFIRLLILLTILLIIADFGYTYLQSI